MQYIKYPRTEHLLGSKFLDLSNFNTHFKDNEASAFPLLIENQSFVIEEKMDGIGLGICFIDNQVYIQQRGHLFPLEQTPDLLKNFKSWVEYNEELLYCIIGNQYTLFGEWLEFKHTVFYNQLDSLFLEYDIFDHTKNTFLSTNQRYKLIDNQLPSVKVVQQSSSLNLPVIEQLLLTNQYSHFNNSQWIKDYQQILTQYPESLNDTIKNGGIEGFYIKIENEYETLQRYKWIRKEFFDIVAQNQHWKNKPIIKNQLHSQKFPFLSI